MLYNFLYQLERDNITLMDINLCKHSCTKKKTYL